MGRPTLVQIVFVLAGAGFFAGSGMLQPGLDAQSRKYELNPPELAENYPFKMLLTTAPGGLRAPILCYLWIRAENLQNDGRYYEAMQLANLICNLQPSFAGVWSFQAWNMAYNISVETHTPEERWHWVYDGGVKLLRDRGIPQNRKSLSLYKELGWIFYHKMGRYMDDMHMYYKQRLAAMMQHLLAAPPYGTTAETLKWFYPISTAPLDKDFRRQGRDKIQQDQLRIILADVQAAAYFKLLKADNIEIGQDLLDVYNRYSLDDAIQSTRLMPTKLTSQRDKRLSELINNPQYRAGRDKLLAFTRAQLLWNVYKMDPQWMYQMMEKFGPIDWRLAISHGLYWTSYGLHIVNAVETKDITSLNTDRMVLNALKALTAIGRLTYIENPRNPDLPKITWTSDWRFIAPTQKEFIAMGKAAAKGYKTSFKASQLSAGHLDYLNQAIEMLYSAYRRSEAQQLLDYAKKTYNPSGPPWSLDLKDFVVWRFSHTGQPTQHMAYSQISSALKTGFVQRALGNRVGYRQSVIFARRIYDAYSKGAPKRIKLPPFGTMARNVLMYLLVNPRLMGVNLSLIRRSDIYRSLSDDMRRGLYDRIAPSLRRECEAWEIDFSKAFPAPPGMKATRRQNLREAP